ncbi:MAG: hypothetical protein ACK5HY_12410 [Parahaliea sp.]
MGTLAEHHLVYAVLSIVCLATSTLLGWQAGFWTFLLMACVLEALRWLGRTTVKPAKLNTRYRA